MTQPDRAVGILCHLLFDPRRFYLRGPRGEWATQPGLEQSLELGVREPQQPSVLTLGSDQKGTQVPVCHQIGE